jgi:hypothetical protein
VGGEDLACAVDEYGAGAAGANVNAEEHGGRLLIAMWCKEHSVEAAHFYVAAI